MGNPNYFGEREREQQKRFADFRTRVSLPLLKLFVQWKITPFHITTLSAVFGLIFGIFVSVKFSVWAVVFLGLHLLADSLDGSLARHLKEESACGAFLDIVTDHVGLMTICALGAIYDEQFGILFPIYGFTYVLMITLVTAGNFLGAKNNVIIRTKYAFFALVSLNLFLPCDELLRWFCMLFLATNVVVIVIAWFKMPQARSN